MTSTANGPGKFSNDLRYEMGSYWTAEDMMRNWSGMGMLAIKLYI
jgi:hypothetical protein